MGKKRKTFTALSDVDHKSQFVTIMGVIAEIIPKINRQNLLCKIELNLLDESVNRPGFNVKLNMESKTLDNFLDVAKVGFFIHLDEIKVTKNEGEVYGEVNDEEEITLYDERSQIVKWFPKGKATSKSDDLEVKIQSLNKWKKAKFSRNELQDNDKLTSRRRGLVSNDKPQSSKRTSENSKFTEEKKYISEKANIKGSTSVDKKLDQFTANESAKFIRTNSKINEGLESSTKSPVIIAIMKKSSSTSRLVNIRSVTSRSRMSLSLSNLHKSDITKRNKQTSSSKCNKSQINQSSDDSEDSLEILHESAGIKRLSPSVSTRNTRKKITSNLDSEIIKKNNDTNNEKPGIKKNKTNSPNAIVTKNTLQSTLRKSLRSKNADSDDIKELNAKTNQRDSRSVNTEKNEVNQKSNKTKNFTNEKPFEPPSKKITRSAFPSENSSDSSTPSEASTSKMKRKRLQKIPQLNSSDSSLSESSPMKKMAKMGNCTSPSDKLRHKSTSQSDISCEKSSDSENKLKSVILEIQTRNNDGSILEKSCVNNKIKGETVVSRSVSKGKSKDNEKAIVLSEKVSDSELDSERTLNEDKKTRRTNLRKIVSLGKEEDHQKSPPKTRKQKSSELNEEVKKPTNSELDSEKTPCENRLYSPPSKKITRSSFLSETSSETSTPKFKRGRLENTSNNASSKTEIKLKEPVVYQTYLKPLTRINYFNCVEELTDISLYNLDEMSSFPDKFDLECKIVSEFILAEEGIQVVTVQDGHMCKNNTIKIPQEKSWDSICEKVLKNTVVEKNSFYIDIIIFNYFRLDFPIKSDKFFLIRNIMSLKFHPIDSDKQENLFFFCVEGQNANVRRLNSKQINELQEIIDSRLQSSTKKVAVEKHASEEPPCTSKVIAINEILTEKKSSILEPTTCGLISNISKSTEPQGALVKTSTEGDSEIIGKVESQIKTSKKGESKNSQEIRNTNSSDETMMEDSLLLKENNEELRVQESVDREMHPSASNSEVTFSQFCKGTTADNFKSSTQQGDFPILQSLNTSSKEALATGILSEAKMESLVYCPSEISVSSTLCKSVEKEKNGTRDPSSDVHAKDIIPPTEPPLASKDKEPENITEIVTLSNSSSEDDGNVKNSEISSYDSFVVDDSNELTKPLGSLMTSRIVSSDELFGDPETCDERLKMIPDRCFYKSPYVAPVLSEEMRKEIYNAENSGYCSYSHNRNLPFLTLDIVKRIRNSNRLTMSVTIASISPSISELWKETCIKAQCPCCKKLYNVFNAANSKADGVAEGTDAILVGCHIVCPESRCCNQVLEKPQFQFSVKLKLSDGTPVTAILGGEHAENIFECTAAEAARNETVLRQVAEVLEKISQVIKDGCVTKVEVTRQRICDPTSGPLYITKLYV